MASNAGHPAQAPAKKQRRDDDKAPGGDSSKNASLISMTRRRVWRACEACRRKKIKCDGVEPMCGQCTQSNTQCTWIQTKDRAALSRQYVQELENRVIRLESVLSQVAPTVNLESLPKVPIPLPANGGQGSSVLQNAQAYTQPSAVVNGGVGSGVPRTGISGTTSGKSAFDALRHRSRSIERTPNNDTSDEFVAEQMGSLALDDHGHLRWIGGSSTMSLIEAFRNFSATEEKDSAPSPPSTQGATPNPPSANLLYFPSSLRFGKVRALPCPEEVEYPPFDLGEKLVDAYFEKFHHTLPVLDSISFKNKYKRLVDARRRAEESGEPMTFGTTKNDAGFVSVVFSVYAVAARFVDDARLKVKDEEENDEETGGMAMVYYERAMILYYIGATATQLAHVQAFVLLSSFLASLNCLPQAWLLCGQALRIAQDLGLHRSPRNLAMGPVNKEIRRKVWWCVYGLDRMLAATLGRPLGAEDSDCDVEFPLPIDDVDLPAHFEKLRLSGTSPSMRDLSSPEMEQQSASLMYGFNALTHLYVIVGRVLRTVYAVDMIDACKEDVKRTQEMVDSLDRELTEWCEKLPSTFKSDPKTPQQISLGAILCSCYYSTLISLHRNFLPTKRKGVPNPNWASVPKAVFASRSCILLSLTTKDAIPKSHHLAFFVQALFSAAVIILLCARFATVESAARTASDEVNTALVCLAALESSWPGAKKCKELLQELVEATRRDMRVQVPGVGRPGSVNGMVPPTPAGIDKVQTVYHSYKRAVGEAEAQKSVEMEGANADEHQPRKIKGRPRGSIGSSGARSEPESPPSGAGSTGASDANGGDSEMGYIVPDQPSTEGFGTYRQGMNGVPINGFSHAGASSTIPLSSIETPTPQQLMNIATDPTFGQQSSMYTHVPQDWLPSPVVDSFGNMSQLNNDIFSNLPLTAGTSQPHSPLLYKNYELSPGKGVGLDSGNFDFSSAEIPFPGFDFLHNFGQSGSGASGVGGSAGLGATDVAAWQSFVQTGAFNDVPDQPFAIIDGAVGDAVEEE